MSFSIWIAWSARTSRPASPVSRPWPRDEGTTDYNFGTTPYAHVDLPGTSVFAKDDAGQVFHTYSSYSRGGEPLLGAFNWLDLRPKGRNEAGVMSWVRLHDEYGKE